MALTKDVNSYVTVGEANAYFVDRLDAAVWSEATDLQKSQALITATSLLDEMHWTGVAVSETQSLAFPRSGSYFDPRAGTTVVLSAAVPARVIDATYELAYHLLNNSGMLDDSGGVLNLQVGSIKLDKITNVSAMPAFVRRSLKPLLVSGGSRIWWRAN